MRIPRTIYFYFPAFLTDCGLFCILLAQPIYALRHLNASPLALGMLGMCPWAGYSLMAVIAGRISDRTGRRGWILFGAGSQAVIGVLLPSCSSLMPFILLATAQLTLLGCFWAPFMGFFSESLPHARLSRALGHYNMSWCLGGILGSFLSGALYDRVGPWAPFLAGAAMTSGSFAIVLLCHPAPIEGNFDPHPMARPRAILFMKQAWLVLTASFFVVNLILYIFPMLAETPPLQISAEGISRLHVVRMGAMLITFYIMGASARWHFRQYPVHCCFALMTLMLPLMAWADTAWLFAIPFLAFGAATGIAYCLSAYYSMLSPAGKGANVGIHESLLSLGGVTGPIFGGWMIQVSGWTALPFIAGIVPLLLIWAGCLWVRHKMIEIE